MNLDSIDRKILKALQRDGRQKLADLSAAAGLSATPCARRVAIMEKAGVITGYAAQVDQAAVGLPVSVFISVELDRQTTDAITIFERAVDRMEEVMECFLMTGSRDILMRVVCADLAAFDRFLEQRLMKVEGIRNLRSSFTLRTMVQRQALPV